jgi:hypothetical protein
MQAYVGQFLATFKEYPPRQKAASFSIDQVMEQLTGSLGSKLAWAPDRRGGQPGGGAARAVGLGRAISAA